MGMFFSACCDRTGLKHAIAQLDFNGLMQTGINFAAFDALLGRLVPKLSFHFEQTADLACDAGQAARWCSFE